MFFEESVAASFSVGRGADAMPTAWNIEKVEVFIGFDQCIDDLHSA